MNSLFFFYTLGILVICIVTSVLSLAAYASSRRRIFIYGCALFALYATEIVEIFFNEWLSQNMAFPISEYYDITMPITRTLVVTGVQACIWLMATDIVDKHSKRLTAIPVGIFFVSNVLVLELVPVGPWQQWLYYTSRQAFLYYVMGYMAWVYLRSPDKEFRARLGRFRVAFFVILALITAVLVEDTYVILLRPASATSSWLLLYLSERNISENILACFFAVIMITYAYRVLSIRMKEAPVKEDVDDLERHIDEQLPFFCEAHKLSKREADVLRLVILGKNNQEIAQELFLAVGTVKTHVHNILVKTERKSREALILGFWQE